MRLMKRLFSTYYLSIHDCSIHSWSRARKNGNYTFLQRRHFNTPSNKIDMDNSLSGEYAYMELLSQIWHEFGQSKELKKEIELRRDLFDVSMLYIQSDDRSLLNDIKLIKADLDKMIAESGAAVEVNFDEQVSKLAKHLGRAINQKETSVFEYYAATN